MYFKLTVNRQEIYGKASGCLILMMVLMGCSQTSTPPTAQTSSSVASLVTPSPNSSPVASSFSSVAVSDTLKISSAGIGSAKLGMTLGQLKKLLSTKAEFTLKSPFMVDFDAIAVSQSGKVQYYILYPAGKPLTDTDKITVLLTDNSNYRTAQGVGPGTLVQQAETTYGDATLSYNTALEGREYVSFANQLAKNIFFRLGSAGDNSLAGIYPSTVGEYNQTKKYQENASIRSVSVSCQGQTCRT